MSVIEPDPSFCTHFATGEKALRSVGIAWVLMVYGTAARVHGAARTFVGSAADFSASGTDGGGGNGPHGRDGGRIALPSGPWASV